MNGGRRRRVTRTPLTAPNPPAATSPRMMASGTGRPCVTASLAIRMVVKTMTAPLDRSMPPVRMTSV